MKLPAYRLGSVDRVLRLLVLLRRRGSLRVLDAAAELGVAASTAHRLLAMLRMHEFAVQDGSRIYRPGPALAAVAATPTHDSVLAGAARPHLGDLARDTGETVHLMVLEGAGARFIDGVEGSHALRVASRVGFTLPAHVTSGGKVLLAELSRDQLGELYPRGLALTPDAAGPELGALMRELTAVRRRGYAVNVEQSEQGVNAIGAAVRDANGRALAAIVVAAPSLRLPRRSMPALVEALQASAAAISASLPSRWSGGRGGSPPRLDETRLTSSAITSRNGCVIDDIESQLRPFTADEFDAAFACLAEAFGEDFTDLEAEQMVFEPERSLGLWADDRVVATSGIYSRDLTVPGAVVPFAAVTLVSVAGTHRRQGVLTAMMDRQLREVHERGTEAIAALFASEAAIYGRFGYGLAGYRGRLHGELARMRLRAEVDTGTGRVYPVPEKDFRSAAIPLYDEIRTQTPGLLSRKERWWDSLLADPENLRKGKTARRYLLHEDSDGTVTGFASYRRQSDWGDAGADSTVHVIELHARRPAARAALWQYVLSMDLARHLSAPTAGRDDPLRHMLADARAVGMAQVDGLFVRLVDVDAALAARRYPAPIDLILEVDDSFCGWNTGRWRLTGGPSYARCVPTGDDPDLAVSAETLGAAYLGDTSLSTLAAAGRVREITPGALAAATASFGWPVPSYTPEDF